MLATILTFHRWTAETLAPTTVTVSAIPVTGCIHRAGPAILRRVHWATLAVVRARSFRAALRIAHPFGARSVPISRAFQTRLIAAFCDRRWVLGGCRRKRRLNRRLGVLSQQWRDTESEGTAEPGDWVGFRFH